MNFKQALAVAGLVTASAAANATPITLDVATIQTFDFISASGDFDSATTSDITNFGSRFTAVWEDGENDPETATFGTTGLGYDWTAYDTFLLSISNQNENNWDFFVTVEDIDGDSVESATTSLPADPTLFTTFSVDLTSNIDFDVDKINTVSVTVGADLPIGTLEDRNAEFVVTRVPEPGSLALLGLGLAGLGFSRRKQR